VRRTALILLAALLLAACGASPQAAPPTASTPAPAPAPDPPQRLTLGLTEPNPALLAPGPQPEPFARWRDELAGLRPRVVRVLVEWHKLQPDPSRPPELGAPRGGCLRDVRPCAPHGGLRAQFEAIAALRRTGREVEPLVVVYGTPAWAARPPAGCERAGTEALSRPPSGEALGAYGELLRAVGDLARRAGAPVAWWAPWNEPNHPYFVAPQRPACDPAAPSAAPAAYTQVVRTARAALGPRARLLLGELAGYRRASAQATTVGELVAGLPDDVACDGAAWSVHQYVGPSGTAEERRAGTAGAPDAVVALEEALDARPCTAGRPVWVTETGAGAERPGRPRDGTEAELLEGCRRLAEALVRWDADPRVAAVLPYTAREDPLFPVGLLDPALTRAYPALGLWRAWGATRPGQPAPGPEACGPAGAA
jgi:hypothetical protein